MLILNLKTKINKSQLIQSLEKFHYFACATRQVNNGTLCPISKRMKNQIKERRKRKKENERKRERKKKRTKERSEQRMWEIKFRGSGLLKIYACVLPY